MKKQGVDKRSVVLGSGMTRRATSINVSAEDWAKLKAIAGARRLTLRELIEAVDADRRATDDSVSLSEALRRFVRDQTAQKAFAA
jgi:predicted DNA-binding ribbon-helix-helix protein